MSDRICWVRGHADTIAVCTMKDVLDWVPTEMTQNLQPACMPMPPGPGCLWCALFSDIAFVCGPIYAGASGTLQDRSMCRGAPWWPPCSGMTVTKRRHVHWVQLMLRISHLKTSWDVNCESGSVCHVTNQVSRLPIMQGMPAESLWHEHPWLSLPGQICGLCCQPPPSILGANSQLLSAIICLGWVC